MYQPPHHNSQQRAAEPLQHQLKPPRHVGVDKKYGSNESYSRESRGTHQDRIIRRHNDYTRSNRYGGSRASKGPYDRPHEQTWRQKVEKPLATSVVIRDNHVAQQATYGRFREIFSL